MPKSNLKAWPQLLEGQITDLFGGLSYPSFEQPVPDGLVNGLKTI